jgi:hypothetical protein
LLNLKDRQGLSLDLEADGSGALLAIRLESPRHLAYGAVADRYVLLNFIGRRRITLLETESSRWSDYIWNDRKGEYNVYRETIDFAAVESISVWLQNLPTGRETRCRLGPIRAAPMAPSNVRNPRLTLGGQSIEWPVDLSPGGWIEGTGPDDCAHYGPKGEHLGKITPRGPWPTVKTGQNTVGFQSEPRQDPQPRAKVTIFTQGETLSP